MINDYLITMYAYILCTCGRLIGHVYRIYRQMLLDRIIATLGEEYKDINPSHLSNLGIKIEMKDALDELYITHECCRTRVMAAVEFVDVY